MKVNVLIIDDREVMRLGIEQMLVQIPSFIPVRICTTLPEAVDHLRAYPDSIDLALLNIHTGATPGIYPALDGMAQLDTRVVIYGVAGDRYLMRQVLRSAVSGVIPLRATGVELEKLLLAVMLGEQPLDQDPLARGDLVGLSPRQQQVLALYADGQPAKEVASRTGLRLNTVHDYLDRIRVKYSQAGRPVSSRVDFYRRAVEDGLLSGST